MEFKREEYTDLFRFQHCGKCFGGPDFYVKNDKLRCYDCGGRLAKRGQRGERERAFIREHGLKNGVLYFHDAESDEE